VCGGPAHDNGRVETGAAGRQVRHDQGRDLYTAGEAPQSLQFLLDGRLRRTGESGGADLPPPAALAFELLASQPIGEAKQQLEMIALLAHASGSRGMAGGQAIDLAAVLLQRHYRATV